MKNKKTFSGGVNALFQETDKRIKNDSSSQSDNKIIKQVRNKAIKPVGNKPVSIVSKEKATFNLSKWLLEDLDNTWIELRQARKDKRISKTDIVQFALEQLLADHKERRQASKLTSLIVLNKTS